MSPLSTYLRTRGFNRPTFRLTRHTNHWKNTAFRDFSNIWRGCIFFLLTFAQLHLLSADLTTLLCFSTVHIVGSLLFKLPSMRNASVKTRRCSWPGLKFCSFLARTNHGDLKANELFELEVKQKVQFFVLNAHFLLQFDIRLPHFNIKIEMDNALNAWDRVAVRPAAPLKRGAMCFCIAERTESFTHRYQRQQLVKLKHVRPAEQFQNWTQNEHNLPTVSNYLYISYCWRARERLWWISLPRVSTRLKQHLCDSLNSAQ